MEKEPTPKNCGSPQKRRCFVGSPRTEKPDAAMFIQGTNEYCRLDQLPAAEEGEEAAFSCPLDRFVGLEIRTRC